MLLYYHKYNYSSKYLYMWDIYHVHLKYIGAISLPKVSYVWRVRNQLLFKKDPIEKGSLIFQEGKAAAAAAAAGHVFHFHFRKDHGCFWHSTLKLASPLAHSLSLSLMLLSASPCYYGAILSNVGKIVWKFLLIWISSPIFLLLK